MSQPQPWSFGVVAIREGYEVGSASVKSLYDVGCAAVIQQVEQFPDGRYALLLMGDRRFRVVALDESQPYLQAEVEFFDEGSSHHASDLDDSVRRQFADCCEALGASSIRDSLPAEPTQLSYVVASTMLIALGDRQELLETPETAQRLQVEAGLLARELGLIRTGTVPVAPPRLPPSSMN